MEPLKDGVRHGSGVGVEMTMSLSGPPGFSRHTTVSSENIHQFMSRQHQQKVMSGVHDPRSSVLNSRALPVDTRGGGHGGHGLSHDPRLSMDLQQHQGRDMVRPTHDPRSIEAMVPKNAPPRMLTEAPQHHQMSMQHSGHRTDSRNYVDPRLMLSQEKRGSAPESRSSRDPMLVGEPRGGPMSISTSGRSVRQPQQSPMPALTMTEPHRVAYDGMEPGMTAYSSLSSSGGAPMLTPHGSGSGKSTAGSQGLPSPQIVMSYSGQKPGRASDSLGPAGPPLHHASEQSMYMSGKPPRAYHMSHQKPLPPGHYMSEMAKSSMDNKSVLGHNPGEQLSPQHRELMRDHGAGDIRDRDLRYSGVPSPMSRSIQKPSLEMSSNHMKHQEELLRKSASFVGPPQGMYKQQAMEPHAGLTKAMTYPLGVDVSHRGGQAPPPLTTHLSPHQSNLQPISHSSYPSPQSHSDRGVSFPMEQLQPGRLQKSVIRPSMSLEEIAWREGGYPSEPSKQPRPMYPGEDAPMSSTKNVLPHMSELDSSHPPLRDVGLPRMQGSISTGQPRIIYETPKSSNYTEQRVQSIERFSSSQRDYAPPRPSSIGRSPHVQQTSLIMPQEERPVHNQQEKSALGHMALDLTKLPHANTKQGDSPLDLTVKTKKRPLEDADTAEYERMVSAAKRVKTDPTSSVSGMLNQKGAINSLEMASMWKSSPSPRGPESYDSMASPSYTSHMSPTVPRQNKYGYSVDGRMSAESRMTGDGRLSVETRISVDGRASVESRSSAGCRTPSSPHLHGKFPMVPPHGKVGSSSMVTDMVKHASGNPPMVPLTTQLLKVKEEQAHQRKLQRLVGENNQSPYLDSKRMYKDGLSPRGMEMVAGNANEVIVVRHPQQHYDLSPQQQHQHNLQQTYKQQQHLQQQQQQSMDVHNQQLQQQQHRQKLSEPQEIIELGMKDSSDPLQASRSSFARSFSQGLIQQQQQQQQQQQHLQQHQLFLQQRQMPHKDQMMPMQTYQQAQEAQYSKEQMMQQQAFTKQQSQSSLPLHHYQNTLYTMKPNEPGYYQKQGPPQPAKHSEMKPYKQASGSSQNTIVGTQKWSTTQQKSPLKAGYPQPAQNSSGNYLPLKGTTKPAVVSNHSPEQLDIVKFGSTKADRPVKPDFLKTSFSTASGPLPVGGVREESRRALRRGSYPTTEPAKHIDGTRKESTSSLPEKSAKLDMAEIVVPSQAKQDSTELVGSSPDKAEAKLEEKSISGDIVQGSQKITGNNMTSKDSSAPLVSGQFAIPLSVTIPQSTSPVITSTPSPASSGSTPKSTGTKKACWSKKHMILNAVNKDESLKRIISSSARKHEAGGISTECKSRIIASSVCSPIPTSPKMPILSPQEDEGEVASEELGVRAQSNNDNPPILAPVKRGQGKSSASRVSSSSSSSYSHSQAGSSTGHASENHLVKEAYKNNNNNSHEIVNNNSSSSFNGGPSAAVKDVPPGDMPGNAIVVRRCSLGAAQTEHQQLPLAPSLEDTQKSSSGNVTFPRAEVIRRNYLDGPNWGHVKNIPIANVAPFVHSRVEDEKSKHQKIEELAQLQLQGAAVSAPTYLVQSQSLPPDVKEDAPRIKPEELNLKPPPDGPDKEVSQLLASSSRKEITGKKKKLTKLRVSSPTKMKDLEIISPSLEYTVLKTSSAELDEVNSREKLEPASAAVKKSSENRVKYKHKIVREKNTIVKPKKLVKKRIQYVFDDDENEEEEEEEDLFIEDDDEDDEDFEYEGGGDKGGKKASKADTEAKIRDREERALRREQLRDQSEESTGRHSLASLEQSPGKTKDRGVSGGKLRSKPKGLGKSKTTTSGQAKNAARISKRRVSSTNQRAQELKHNAIVQRRNTGKRKIRRYNRNAAYEQELHKEANRRAVVRAKRQASSKARERLQQQRDQSLDNDNEDTVMDEPWELSETSTAKVGAPVNARKAHQHHQGTKVSGAKGSAKGAAVPSSGGGRSSLGKGGSAGGSGGQHKEDYESDVENVPDDLAAEMVVSEDGSAKKRRARAGKVKCKQGGDDEDAYTEGGQEEEGDYGPDHQDVLSSIPIENVPAPADVKKLTINKNSGETLLHRAARIGHEEITLYCLKTRTVHVNARDNAGYTPLHESCVRGSVTVARHLIYYGADVNCCSQDGIRPIHDAIENDHLEVVRLLLVHGADPLIATYAGRTPVRIAKSLPMLQTLQGYISDLNGWADDEDDEDHVQEATEEIPWRFTSSLVFTKSLEIESYSPCVDLPSDPQDDRNDVFDDGPTSAINVFNLALEGEDRTPQPFCLLDEVLFRLAMPKEKLTALYPWKPMSVTLSSERVREVASCCCSNVSIRLPQSGKVTLLPLSTLKEIESALKQQMKFKVKKEEVDVMDISQGDTFSTIITKDQMKSFVDEGESFQKEGQCSKSPSASPSVTPKQKSPKSGSSSSFPGFQPSSMFIPLSVNNNSGMPKLPKSHSQSWTTSSSPADHQVGKKASSLSQHHQHHHQPLPQQAQHKQQASAPAPPRGEVAAGGLTFKASSVTSKEGRGQLSTSSSSSRKSKKEESDSPWLNAPMFSDDSSSSPFHTSLDCFDSDNSM